MVNGTDLRYSAMWPLYLFFTGCALGIGLACTVLAIIIATDIRSKGT